jgi:NAD(P)-dependent dehydrogenase (short-subunit alcohol dehydrogenase family)
MGFGMMMRGKTCLITGGAGSIGRAAAAALLAQGAQVMLVDRDEAALAAASAELGGAVAVAAADVTRGADAARYVAATVERFGAIDVLFANAGVFGVVRPVVEYPDEVFDEVMAVSVRGAFLAAKHAAPAMRDGGSIVIMSSIMGLTADPGVAAYATAKHAVVGLMRVLAKELAGRRIRVNTIHPGPVANGFQGRIEAELSGILGTDATAFLDGVIPFGRHGTAEEVAQAVLFLASGMSGFVTGTTLAVDGGMGI